MKVDSFKNNRKALFALLLCSGFIATHPLAVMAESESYSVQNVQQKQTVSGIVKDSSGEPIIGASVLEKGTTNGTITDLDGKFTLSVSSNAVLQISYIGYKTLEVKSSPNMRVILKEDTETLDEVVVVGYGVQKKSDVTGSVTSVSKDRLSKLPVTNVLQAIQGATAGITITQTSSVPGDAPTALVRGQNSINASSGPYIIVDGVPISKSGGTLNDINPNDIESMEILKDASATAIYGTNGANGVILITTKRGKTGKPTIKYSGYLGIEDFSNRLKFRDGAQMVEAYKWYKAAGGSGFYDDGPVRNEYEVENYKNGIETDWIDEVSQTGIIQNHNISVGGGAENVQYYVSADYMDQKGVLKGFNYKRYSIRTNIDMNVTDFLKVGTNSYIVSHNRDGGRVNFTMAQAMSPYAKMYEEDGSYCIWPMRGETLFTNPMLGTTTNPERRQWNINLNGYADVDFGSLWSPLKGLLYKLNAGFSYIPKRSSYYNGRSVNDNEGTGSITNEETQSYTIENILSYNRDFDKHHIDVTALYAASRRKYQSSVATSKGFFSDELGWDNLSIGTTPSVSSYKDLYTTISQMGRINYSYDSRYLFTFTVRRDGSSVFSDGSKYGVFPSVALGWNISRESFMEPISSWMNNLKLRVSYGMTGNEAIGVYSTMNYLNYGGIPFSGASVVGMWGRSEYGNSELTWEKTKTFNIGLDFGFLNNRINGSLDVYSSNTNDVLMKRSLPNMSGYTSMWANMGKTANKGVELTVNTKNIVTKDFTWSSSLVFSWNKNEIKDLYGDKKSDIGNRWFIGEPIGVIYDYVMEGIWQEEEISQGIHLTQDPDAVAGAVKLKDISGPKGIPDGKISPEYDKVVQGQTTPKWIGGFTNTFTWKDLTLSVFIQTVQGVKKANDLYCIASDELGRRNTPVDLGYWTPENKSNEFKSLSPNSNPYFYSFPKNASFTRIKDITLSYNIPQSLLNKTRLGGLTLYVSGRNLFTFTDWLGWDPESVQVGRGSSNDGLNYPMVKSYVFGLNVTF